METWEKISEFKIGERMELDHQPIEIEIEDLSEEGIRKFGRISRR